LPIEPSRASPAARRREHARVGDYPVEPANAQRFLTHHVPPECRQPVIPPPRVVRIGVGGWLGAALQARLSPPAVRRALSVVLVGVAVALVVGT